MSETPITTVLDQKSEQSSTNVEQFYTGSIDRDFAAYEQGVETGADSRLDLSRDDVVNTEFWNDNSSQLTQAPEYASRPQTDIEIISQSLEGLDDRQLRETLDQHTKAIANGLRKYVLAA